MSMSDPYRLPGGVIIKFRPSGGHRDGISLTEAMNSVRLSRSHPYAIREIADMRGRLTLKVRVRFSSFFRTPPVSIVLLMFDFIDG
jgi:hypothetical protein